MGNNIYWCYRNKAENAQRILQPGNAGTASTNYGSANAIDFDLNSSFRSDADSGTTILRFDFGSAIYVDSLIVKHNLTNIGTLLYQAGSDGTSWGVTGAIPMAVNGTAVKFISAQSYRYWDISLFGTVAGYHEIFELFLGSRNEFSENPVYPVTQPLKDDVVASETASGQRYVFHNFSRQGWELNYKLVTNSTQQDILKMQKYCKGSFKPLWFSMDPTNTPYDVTFVRLASKSFKYKEAITDTWDVKFKIDEEL